MRIASKIDHNQPAIVQALRQVGATVQVLSHVGKGCPDALVGYRGCNYLLEIKDGAKPPSARKLTADEERWHAEWNGDVLVVESVDAALIAIGAIEP